VFEISPATIEIAFDLSGGKINGSFTGEAVSKIHITSNLYEWGI
jgi:hypothetical protein